MARWLLRVSVQFLQAVQCIIAVVEELAQCGADTESAQAQACALLLWQLDSRMVAVANSCQSHDDPGSPWDPIPRRTAAEQESAISSLQNALVAMLRPCAQDNAHTACAPLLRCAIDASISCKVLWRAAAAARCAGGCNDMQAAGRAEVLHVCPGALMLNALVRKAVGAWVHGAAMPPCKCRAQLLQALIEEGPPDALALLQPKEQQVLYVLAHQPKMDYVRFGCFAALTCVTENMDSSHVPTIATAPIQLYASGVLNAFTLELYLTAASDCVRQTGNRPVRHAAGYFGIARRNAQTLACLQKQACTTLQRPVGTGCDFEDGLDELDRYMRALHGLDFARFEVIGEAGDEAASADERFMQARLEASGYTGNSSEPVVAFLFCYLAYEDLSNAAMQLRMLAA